MKKKYQNKKFKRHSAQRARREEKARERIRTRKRGALTPKKPRRRRKDSRVKAPALFSLTENTDETIRFFTKLEGALTETPEDKIVFIDLGSVTKMTPEVIVVLISRIEEETLVPQLYGNAPQNDVARNMLASSGFYDFVTSQTRVRNPKRGVIEKCGDRIVDPEKAAQLIDQVRESFQMSLKQEDGHQATAIECMTNTREHASGNKNRKGEKKWWFSVYCDSENKVVQFAFVDLGIGIFASLERRKMPWSGSEMRSDLLKKLLANQTGDNGLSPRKRTSTGKGHRGRGLPNIANRNREGQTRRLRIISNNVFADVEKSDYHMLEQEFSGTVVCWEHSVEDATETPHRSTSK
ncbi:MAG: hypothetical protein OXI05_06070 [Bacteroidota bacterium]|nr:hypothetical protein [Bacteroidota bacterium]